MKMLFGMIAKLFENPFFILTRNSKNNISTSIEFIILYMPTAVQCSEFGAREIAVLEIEMKLSEKDHRLVFQLII